MNSIVIVGAGGFGREVYQWLSDQYSTSAIKGFLSPNKSDLDNFGINKPILGTEDDYQFQTEDRFVLAVGSPKLRKAIASKIVAKGGQFINLIHPSAIISPLAIIGPGAIICPFSLVSPHAKIDNFSVLNFYCSVAHDSILGECSVMSPYATLNGNVKVGECVFLGTGVSIAPNTSIGSWSKISAGLSITSDIEENSFLPPSSPKIMKGIARLL